jgi:hypothetical protein
VTRRRRALAGFLPKAAQRWVDGSGAKELIARQAALYVSLCEKSDHILWRERQFQALVIEYIDKRYPEIGSLAFHVPLELLRREKNTAGMFHALGARAGVADVVLLAPRGTYHGLLMELKVPPRRPTHSQCEFLEKARASGYAACWVNGLNTALMLLDAYLALPPRAQLGELQEHPNEHRGNRQAV